MKHQCPVPGCGAGFGKEGSLKGHISRKMDTAHKGLSGPEVVDGNQSVTDAVSEPESDGGDDLDDDDAAPDLSKVKFPENPDADSDGGDDDEISLPCGHESYSEKEAPEPPYSVACVTCGEIWTVKNE